MLLVSEMRKKKKNDKLLGLLGKFGVDIEYAENYDKHTWTDNSENRDLLDRVYPEGYAINPESFESRDGKIKFQLG